MSRVYLRPCDPLRPERFPCPRRASAFAGPRCRAAGAALAAMPATLPGMPMPARTQKDRSPGCRDRSLACGPALPAPAALPLARASRQILEGQREGQGQASGKASGKTGRQASAKAREKPGRGALRPAFGKQAWGKPGMGPLAGFSPAPGAPVPEACRQKAARPRRGGGPAQGARHALHSLALPCQGAEAGKRAAWQELAFARGKNGAGRAEPDAGIPRSARSGTESGERDGERRAGKAQGRRNGFAPALPSLQTSQAGLRPAAHTRLQKRRYSSLSSGM